LAVYQIEPEFAVGTRETIEQIIAIVDVRAECAFVGQSAFVRVVGIHTIFVRITVLKVIAIFVVMASENQIAVLVFESVICIIAIKRVRHLEGDAWRREMQFSEFFEK
jgi:hypothetical protein